MKIVGTIAESRKGTLWRVSLRTGRESIWILYTHENGYRPIRT